MYILTGYCIFFLNIIGILSSVNQRSFNQLFYELLLVALFLLYITRFMVSLINFYYYNNI